MKLLDWLFKDITLPMSTERPCTKPSRSEVKRWLRGRAVNINGVLDHDPMEVVDYSIFTLVFFPNGKKRTTYQ